VLVQSAATTCVAIGVSLRSEGEPRACLLEFYRRVQPPGFWGPVALQCGESPRRSLDTLWRGLGLTVGLALCVFGLLVGTGSWLFGSPPPTWFPWRGPWIAGLLGASALLLVWLRPRLRGGDGAR
jgi:hypothetical protein